MNDIDYLRLFESLPHCDSMCNIVEDWVMRQSLLL